MMCSGLLVGVPAAGVCKAILGRVPKWVRGGSTGAEALYIVQFLHRNAMFSGYVVHGSVLNHCSAEWNCAALRSPPFHSVLLYLAPRQQANVWFVCSLAAGLPTCLVISASQPGHLTAASQPSALARRSGLRAAPAATFHLGSFDLPGECPAAHPCVAAIRPPRRLLQPPTAAACSALSLLI
eukprot:264402-Chlamydomonas_euryale.AAC.3